MSAAAAPLSAWALDGVRPAQRGMGPDDLYRPRPHCPAAGAQGPAFMAFSNFDAI
jgi:membrane-bound lytic murein transglycosylase B